jgi:hypothetical protein
MVQQAQRAGKAPTVDDMFDGWDFNSVENYNKEAKCPDGNYLVQLVEIKPAKLKTDSYGNEKEKAPFIFHIVAEADKFNREIETEYADTELAAFVNIHAFGEKSTLYKVAKALLGDDPRKFGPLKPSQLLNRTCWAKVSSQASEDGENIYTNIDTFMATLPPIAKPAPKSGTAPARPAPTASPPPTARGIATASRQPLPTAAQLKKDKADLFDEDPDPAPEDEEV